MTTRLDGDWAEVRIRDTGARIPLTIQGNILDPFFTTKQVGKGSGQGLAIARSIVVEKHGGTIDFETGPDCGTTFIVRLPVENRIGAHGRESDDGSWGPEMALVNNS